MLQLFIGNKNYSSWSMRPWVLLTQTGIPFEEVIVRFDAFDDTSAFKRTMRQHTPVGKVPLLLDGRLAVWDTLAITEYVAEYAAQHHPGSPVWPRDAAQRARARSICAEMHSGFQALRNFCPMNIEASLPEVGAIVWRDQAGVRSDMARIISMWSELLAEHRGPMLFGEFSAADAYFAPVCMRIRTYALPVPPDVAGYVERVADVSSVRAWSAAALDEHDFVAFDEPYRLQR